MNELRVIGICGKAFAGKTTSANYLVKNEEFYKTAFAKLLKETAKMLYPWMTDEQIYGSLKEVVDTKLGINPRRMLQLLGTEIGRLIWQDTWIDGIKREVENLQNLREDILVPDSTIPGMTYFPTLGGLTAMDIAELRGIVVDDVRFPNEVDSIKNIGGEIWVVVRPESGTSVGGGHESEAHAEAFEKIADHILINDSDFDGLYSQIDSILKI